MLLKVALVTRSLMYSMHLTTDAYMLRYEHCTVVL